MGKVVTRLTLPLLPAFSPFVPPEEAVNEVKRQAMSELQKAVSDAERKAHEMISAERSKMERALAEAKRQASEDALTIINQQEDSSEVSTYHRPLPPPTFHPTLFSSFAALSRVIYYPSLCFLYPRSYLVEAAGCSWLGTGWRCHDYCPSGPVVRVHKSRGGAQMAGAERQTQAIIVQLTTTCW